MRSVVEAIEVVGKGVTREAPGRPRVSMKELGLERAQDALDRGVVIPITLLAHRGAWEASTHYLRQRHGVHRQSLKEILRFLDGARPSLTGIGVAALAAPELQIEVEMVVQLVA